LISREALKPSTLKRRANGHKHCIQIRSKAQNKPAKPAAAKTPKEPKFVFSDGTVDAFSDAVDAIDCLMMFLDFTEEVDPKQLYSLLNPQRNALKEFMRELRQEGGVQ
jgi:hypothetical protein